MSIDSLQARYILSSLLSYPRVDPIFPEHAEPPPMYTKNKLSKPEALALGLISLYYAVPDYRASLKKDLKHYQDLALVTSAESDEIEKMVTDYLKR